jgi:hypothetical protein
MLDLGHSAMKKARFWTGLVMLMSPLTGIVIASWERLIEPRAEVHGRVMYHGRPMRGGMISFASEDRERSADMVGRVDSNGYFSCRPQWWVDRPGRARFRICLYPDPRRPRRDVPQGGSGDSPQAVEMAGAPGGSGGDAVPSARVVPVSLDSPTPDPPGPFADPGASGGCFDPQLRAMEVSVGAEAVQIEIDVKD